MKIKELTIRNYKRFVTEQNISFCNPNGQINDITLLLGTNGSGKTSILQLIAALVGSAVRKNMQPDQLEWSVYNYSFLQNGNLPLKAQATITFTPEETTTTHNFAQRLQDMGKPIPHLPQTSLNIQLQLDYDGNKVDAIGGAGHYFQMSGYQYALQLKTYEQNAWALFQHIGAIYWYTEQRTAFSFQNPEHNRNNTNALRDMLCGFYYFHKDVESGKIQLREGQQDFYANIERLYQQIFPNRSFIGAEPNRKDPYQRDFWLKEEPNNYYELSGMSAGEQAIFPILIDFALMNINNSIVLIDEIELHLNPTMLQTLLRLLPNLGTNNQFIITSHSPYIIRELPSSSILLIDNDVVKPLAVYTQGRDLNSISNDVFGIPARPKEYTEKLSKLYWFIEEENATEAQKLLNELQQLWGEHDSEIFRAKLYLDDLLITEQN